MHTEGNCKTKKKRARKMTVYRLIQAQYHNNSLYM